MLRQGVKVWNEWREEHRKIQPFLKMGNWDKSFYTYPPDLSHVDLSYANLSHADLTDTNLAATCLQSACLQSANLTKANLKSAKLRKADLSQARLVLANLNNADLIGAKISNANLNEANLSAVNFSFANLRETNLVKANLSRAYLRNSDCSNANFSTSYVLYADFTGATLTGACIEEWHISGSTKLENVNCEYIYRNVGEDGQYSNRLPIDSNRLFLRGEFELWASVRASALETIDLTFAEGLDWQDFFSSLQEVRQQNPDTGIFLQGVEERNGQYVVRLRIETDKTGSDRACLEAKIETMTKELVEKDRQLHEAHGEENALERTLEKTLRMATNQGPKYNFQGAQFAGGFAEIVQGDQNGGTINNYGSNTDDIVRLLSSLDKLSQTFPEAQQQQVQVHLEDLATDLKQPEKCSSVRLTTRIANLFGVLILLGGGIATATDFANNVLELSEKLNVPTQEFQPQLQQFKQIYPDFDWQS